MPRSKPLTVVKQKPIPVKIQVIGVWDTVGALGLPQSWFTNLTGVNKGKEFFNTALNDNKFLRPFCYSYLKTDSF